MNATVKVDEQNALNAIANLDLDAIKVKLMDREQGHGWTREYADRMETAYKRYLTLLVKFPDVTIAPTKEMDKFWHAHILDTLKYAEDCQTIFGKFLHHFPYYGMRGEADQQASKAAGDAMAHLYEQEFGEPLPQSSAWCIKADIAWCIKADRKADDSAWCIKADKGVDDLAWCIKADKGANNSAWCIKADAAMKKSPDVTTRPTLSA